MTFEKIRNLHAERERALMHERKRKILHSRLIRNIKRFGNFRQFRHFLGAVSEDVAHLVNTLCNLVQLAAGCLIHLFFLQ